MKHLTRRSVTTGMVAAVTAIPAVGLPSAPTKGQSRLIGTETEDKLLGIIRRYEDDLKQIKATSPLTDKQLDAMVDSSTDRLAEAIGVPALTAAGALAAFELLRETYFSHLGKYESTFEDAMLALAEAVRGYIASTGEVQS